MSLVFTLIAFGVRFLANMIRSYFDADFQTVPWGTNILFLLAIPSCDARTPKVRFKIQTKSRMQAMHE